MKARCLNCSHDNEIFDKQTYTDGDGEFILCEECDSSFNIDYVLCPYCEGEGQVEDMADDVFGNARSFYHQCDCCDGDGHVLKSEYDSIKEVYIKSNREVMEQIRKGV